MGYSWEIDTHSFANSSLCQLYQVQQHYIHTPVRDESYKGRSPLHVFSSIRDGPVSHLLMNSATSLSTNDSKAGRKEIRCFVRSISVSMKSLKNRHQQ